MKGVEPLSPTRRELVTNCHALAVCVGRPELTVSVLEMLDLDTLKQLRLTLLVEYLETAI